MTYFIFNFVTCYLADNSIDKIRAAPIWDIDKCLKNLEKSMKQDQMNAIVTKPSDQEKMKIYIKHRKQNLHKMEPIPVCSMEKFK